MGSTFSAVHVQAPRERVRAEVLARLSKLGWRKIEASAFERPEARHVLICDEGGFTSVADEDAELEPEVRDDWAKHLSARCEALAIGIGVFHSDFAELCAYRGGELLGAVRVPEGATVDRDGSKWVDVSFLQQPRARADHTFPEQTVVDVARAAGVPWPGLGARYGIRGEAPKNAEVLVFEHDARAARASGADTPASGPSQLEVRLLPAYPFTCGTAMLESAVAEVALTGGAAVSGLDISLSGPAVAALGITAVRGWSGDFGSASPPATADFEAVQRWMREQRAAAEERMRPVPLTGGAVRFPNARLESPPAGDAFSERGGAAALRAFQQSLQASGAAKLMLGLVGTPVTAGSHALRVTVRGGGAEASTEGVLEVKAAKRVPVLPTPKTELSFRDDQLLDDYHATGFANGWVAFDTSFAAARDFVLELVSDLAASGAPELHARLTTDGRHPEVKAVLKPGERMLYSKWSHALDMLEGEGVLTLEPEWTEGRVPASIVVSHAPNGTPVLPRAFRSGFTAPPSVPLSVTFSLPRGPESLEALVERAVARADCIGAWLSNGGVVYATVPHLPYEELAGVSQGGELLAWVRAHPRAPGWRVLVPRPAAARVVREGVDVGDVPGGLWVKRRGPLLDPAEGDVIASERAVVGCIGSPEALLALRRPPE